MNIFYINLKKPKYFCTFNNFNAIVYIEMSLALCSLRSPLSVFASKVKTKNVCLLSLVSSDRRENVIEVLRNTSVEICGTCRQSSRRFIFNIM